MASKPFILPQRFLARIQKISFESAYKTAENGHKVRFSYIRRRTFLQNSLPNKDLQAVATQRQCEIVH